MAQAEGGSGFVDKAPEHLFVADEARGQFLNGNLFAEMSVAGVVDVTESSPAKLAQDAVLTVEQRIARFQHLAVRPL